MSTKNLKSTLIMLLSVAIMGGSGMAQSVEEPEHELVGKIGELEIRKYPASIQAVTALENSARTSAGFRRLAGFIFGANDGAEKIAMTAPVQETLGVARPELAFTMPSGYDMDTLPAPRDASVSLVEVPARTVAVISFSGWASSAKVERYSNRLQTAIEARDLAMISEPMLNQYNPPWTPPFLRRNEIMVEIEEIAGFQ